MVQVEGESPGHSSPTGSFLVKRLELLDGLLLLALALVPPMLRLDRFAAVSLTA